MSGDRRQIDAHDLRIAVQLGEALEDQRIVSGNDVRRRVGETTQGAVALEHLAHVEDDWKRPDDPPGKAP